MAKLIRFIKDYCNSDHIDHLRCGKCGSLKKTACWYVDCPRHT